MAKDNIKEENRYWEKMSCEICKKCIGWAPYMRSAYQCTDCNKLPPWDDGGAGWDDRSIAGAGFGTRDE